jgi:hypothetical protein
MKLRKVAMPIFVLVAILFAPGVAFAIGFNIDFGAGASGPGYPKLTDPTFATPSGQLGEWNQVFISTQFLDDLSGNQTAASITVTALADGYMATGGALTPLLGDYFYGHDPMWTVTVTGLDDGPYGIYIYGPCNTIVHTGDMLVNGTLVSNISGNTPTNWIWGTNYTGVGVDISGGQLTLEGIDSGTATTYGLGGLQIVPGEFVIPEPTTLALLGLSALGLLGYGRRRKRR